MNYYYIYAKQLYVRNVNVQQYLEYIHNTKEIVEEEIARGRSLLRGSK